MLDSLREPAITMAEVAEQLSEGMPWFPLDFIRTIDEKGARGKYVEQLTKPIPQENDLSMISESVDGTSVVLFAQKLPWDTAFFGYGVARLDAIVPLQAPFYAHHADHTPAVLELLRKAHLKSVRYLFSVVDCRDLAAMRALGRAGFDLIETRAYYHMPLKEFAPTERYRVRAAVSSDILSLGAASRDSVNIYDRFHADAFISAVDADRLMYKWVEASIDERFADITIVPDCSSPGAFCTVRYHKEHWDAWGLKVSQPVLSAVGPAFKGWYKKLISEINLHLRDEVGAEHSYLCTQLANKAVIWVWESLGYRFGKAEHIFRKVL